MVFTIQNNVFPSLDFSASIMIGTCTAWDYTAYEVLEDILLPNTKVMKEYEIEVQFDELVFKNLYNDEQ